MPPRAHAQCGAAAASSRKKALGPGRAVWQDQQGTPRKHWERGRSFQPSSLAALTPAPGGGTQLSLSCGSAPRPAWRPHAGVRWLVAVVPSNPAASWPELGPRGHSCRSHSTTRVLGAEPASCLAEGLRERRLPARGAEARTCTCLGRHSPQHRRPECPLQRAAGAGLRWAAGRRWPSRAVTSPSLEPPLPLTQHVQGRLPTSRLEWRRSRPHRKQEQAGRLEGLLSPPAPSQLLDPFLGTTALRPLLGGSGGPGRRLAGPPREGRGPSQPPAPPGQRSDTACSVTLSYSWESLSTLIIPGYRLKYLFCHNVSLGCVGPFLCSLC